MLKNILRMAPVPANQDAGLLALRLAAVVPLLLKHGLEKVLTFSAMARPTFQTLCISGLSPACCLRCCLTRSAACC